MFSCPLSLLQPLYTQILVVSRAGTQASTYLKLKCSHHPLVIIFTHRLCRKGEGRCLKVPQPPMCPFPAGKPLCLGKIPPPGCTFCFWFEFELPDKQHTGSHPHLPSKIPAAALARCSQALLKMLSGKGIICYWRMYLCLAAIRLHKYVECC